MRLHVALVGPARFIERAKIGLRFHPCFVLFLCPLPLYEFLLCEDFGTVYMLYVDLHLLVVGCLHAHVCAFKLRLVQVSFVCGYVGGHIPCCPKESQGPSLLQGGDLVPHRLVVMW